MIVKRLLSWKSYILGLGTILILTSGCVTTKYKNPLFKPNDIERIVILPFMDNRKSMDPDHDILSFCSDSEAMIFSELKFEKHYRTLGSSNIGQVDEYSPAHLPREDPGATDSHAVDPLTVDTEWVKRLGPAQAKWVLVPVVEDVKRFNVLIRKGAEAEVSLYLFNKETGELWCKTYAQQRFAAGCLIAPLLEASIGKYMWERATMEMSGQRAASLFPTRQGPFIINE